MGGQLAQALGAERAVERRESGGVTAGRASFILVEELGHGQHALAPRHIHAPRRDVKVAAEHHLLALRPRRAHPCREGLEERQLALELGAVRVLACRVRVHVEEDEGAVVGAQAARLGVERFVPEGRGGARHGKAFAGERGDAIEALLRAGPERVPPRDRVRRETVLSAGRHSLG